MTDPLRKAAEMALEALEWNYGTDLENIENCMAWLEKMNATIPALRQALAQPEQDYERGFVDGMQKQMQSTVEKAVNAMTKRKWVGLTDVEIMGMTCECVDDGTFNMDCARDFANRIEAKLKEKNT